MTESDETDFGDWMVRRESKSAESAKRAQEAVRQAAIARSELRRQYWLEVLEAERTEPYRSTIANRVKLEDCLIYRLSHGDFVAGTLNKYRTALERWTADAGN